MTRNRAWTVVVTLAAVAALLLTAGGLAAPARAAENKPDPTFTDPDKAGPDFKVQGEYVGTVAGDKDRKIGVQVIALGDGKFHACFLNGGLPGEGWDQKDKVEIDGATKEAKTVFEGKGWEAAIEDGKLQARNDKAEKIAAEKVARKSPMLEAKPPAGAVVLFDGSTADTWQGGHMDDRKLLAAGCKSKQGFTDFTMHVEFFLPFKPFARGQGRANSGVYLQDRYEIQVLDSFGLAGKNNECGGIYTKSDPKVNMCLPPLTWQTYDVEFTAAKFDESGKKIKDAVATGKHNGVVVQDNVAISGPTGGGAPETAKPGPIQLQGHGNPVFFQNIWVVEKK